MAPLPPAYGGPSRRTASSHGGEAAVTGVDPARLGSRSLDGEAGPPCHRVDAVGLGRSLTSPVMPPSVAEMAAVIVVRRRHGPLPASVGAGCGRLESRRWTSRRVSTGSGRPESSWRGRRSNRPTVYPSREHQQDEKAGADRDMAPDLRLQRVGRTIADQVGEDEATIAPKPAAGRRPASGLAAHSPRQLLRLGPQRRAGSHLGDLAPAELEVEGLGARPRAGWPRARRAHRPRRRR